MLRAADAICRQALHILPPRPRDSVITINGIEVEVIDSILAAVEKWRPTSIEDRVRLEVPMEAPDGLTKAFVEELAGHDWLADAYEERGD